MSRVRSDVRPDARVTFAVDPQDPQDPQDPPDHSARDDDRIGVTPPFVRLDDCLLDVPGALYYLQSECGFSALEAEEYLRVLPMEVIWGSWS